MPEYTDERVHTPGVQPTGLHETKKRRQQPQQSRQLLSCIQCRERKVKCDRTKPCSACCARGQPKHCHFVAEGGDYAPIQQSYEIKKLRAENLRLKERLRSCNLAIENDDSDPVASPDSFQGDRPGSSQKRRSTKQKRFQGAEWQDNIYFGSPGLASVITDFAAINTTPVSASLAHLLPRCSDMYTPKNPPPYPFPTIFPAPPDECIPQLLACLPGKDELLDSLSTFENRINICSFPHVPFEITRSEVERFLVDAKRNAQMCPDMLALLFAAMALGGQHMVWDRSGGQWEPNAMPAELQKGDVFIAAAMQALRLASFMHKPSLIGIQALIMIGPYLTNSGRFLDAWTLFGTTIRLAHSIGLHRHPKYLDPAPPTQRECSVRQTLWWWILHMDEQYSMTLGRPLGISGIGDCPPPNELTTDPQILRFGEFVNHFTLLARQILSSDRLTTTRIDEFTDELRKLQETMPEMLQFDRSWLQEDTEIPDWPLSAMAAVYYCKTHTYLILLNRQRSNQTSTTIRGSATKSPISKFRPVNRMASSQSSPTNSTKNLPCGRDLVLTSSADLLDAFLFLYMRVPAALISWNVGQQAFNACLILLIDALELKKITTGATKVEKAFVVFKELQEVHKLAVLAVEKISWGLVELRNVTQTSTEAPKARPNHGDYSQKHRSEGNAKPMAHAMYEGSVMSATGMLLLEDPGLQGFVSEAFAPIEWNTPGSDPTRLLQLKHKQGSSQSDGKNWNASSEGSKSTEDVHDVRSAEVMQGIRRSTIIQSAPMSNTTPPMGDHAPRSVTAPTLHTKFFEPKRQHQSSKATTTQLSLPCSGPPHLRHESISHTNHTNPIDQPIVGSSDESKFKHAPNLPNQNLISASQLRHNSCPSLPLQLDSTRTTSTYTDPTPGSSNIQNQTGMSSYPPASQYTPHQSSFAAFTGITAPSCVSSSDPATYPAWATSAASWPNQSTRAPSSHSVLPPHADSISPGVIRDDTEHTALGYRFSSQNPPTSSPSTTSESHHSLMEGWRSWTGSNGAV